MCPSYVEEYAFKEGKVYVYDNVICGSGRIERHRWDDGQADVEFHYA